MATITLKKPKKISYIDKSLLDIKKGRTFSATSSKNLITKCLQ